MGEESEKNICRRIKARQSQLEDARRPMEPVWKDVISLIRPELSPWDDTSTETAGKKRGIQTYNASPEEGLEYWCDGMQGIMASPSLDWFSYAHPVPVVNKHPVVRRWFQEFEATVYSVMRNSNFYPALNPVFRDAGSIGSGCSFIEEDLEKSSIIASTFHPRELYVAEDHRHRVHIWHRYFTMTALNAVEKFGTEKLSRNVRDSLSSNPFRRFDFIHAIYRKDDPILKNQAGLPDRNWISFYIEVNPDPEKEPEPLSVSGYRSRPYAYWRYSKASDTVYGWGLGCSALVDIIALNNVSMTLLKAGHQAVEPPLLVHKSLRGRISLIPGSQSFYERPGEGAEPLLKGINFPIGVDREQALREAIDRRFNVDFFLMLARSDKSMTATEIIEKIGERSTLLGPKVGRMESELLDPIHDRIFEICLTNNWVPPPPDILLDQPNGRIDVEYNGPLSQAQRIQHETRRSQRVFSELAPLVQLNPGILDNFDLDKTSLRIARDGFWPEDELRSEEQVLGIRQARQEAAQAQAQMEMMERAAQQMPHISKAPEAGSLAERMMGAK